ncbi:MAG: flagellar hook protein FlgE [Alphaproteobacteria bacterium]|nr:flagellar hook protein FlgE [Alphaproteobacteria bacterium]
MSIYTAMRSGVSALAANSSAMAVISDNIANLNTVGYKRGLTDFTAMLNSQTGGTSYNAGGVLSSTRRLVDVQGSLEQSRSATDLAVAGNGFFVVSENNQPLTNGGSVAFTRAGSFSVDAQGFLQNAQGFYLQGWPIQADGSVASSPTSLSTLSPINVADTVSSAEATGEVTLTANLSSTQAAYDPVAALNTYVAGDLATSDIAAHFESSIEIFDSLGAPRTVAVGFLKTAPNTWQVEVYTRPSTLTANPGGLVASGQIQFNTSGGINAGGITGSISGPFNVAWDASTGAAAQDLEFHLENSLSQFATASGVTTVVADGVPPGNLAGLVVENDGILTAQFSNGRSRALYQIPLATFLNPNGLLPDRGGVFRNTLASGLYNINEANAAGAGRIESNVLEASNVDLAAEFTSMIVTQRAYSASSKIITTADEMLEELLRIKR